MIRLIVSTNKYLKCKGPGYRSVKHILDIAKIGQLGQGVLMSSPHTERMVA